MSAIDEKKGLDGPELLRNNSGSFSDEKGGFGPDVAVLESDMQAVGQDVEEAIAAARNMTQEEVEDIIQQIVRDHNHDPNFPSRVLASARRFLEDPSVREDPVEYHKLFEELKVEAALIKINSPYAEVRAVVDNHDDPTMPSSTFRAWFIGLIYVGVGAFINQFFSIRQPGIGVGSNVAQLLAYPAGRLLEAILPTKKFTLFGQEMSLNPGPFNLKEHMVITIMANVGFSAPYTNNVIFVQFIPRFFNQSWASNFGYQILVGLSTNFIGYGLAGLTRRFLVYPAAAIWPQNLATIALNRAFHSGRNEVAHGWKVSRMRYFLYCFVGMFVYFWFPNYIFQALSYFNWITWIAPQNVSLAAISGSVNGLGLNPLPSFDWNYITVGGDPIINPFFVILNAFIGTAITLPIIAAIWYTNVFNTAYLPINSNGVFDNTGSRYNVSLTVNDDALFDEESYMQYSPAYLAAGNILLYGIFFAVYTATISHAILYHRHEIASGFRSLLSRRSYHETNKDVHSRLMTAYKEVPELWYFGLLVSAIAVGAAGVGAFPTHTTPAVVLYGVFLALIFCIPIGIITSVTNVQVTLNVLAEFLGGLWFPGNAAAMNYFKSYGYVTTAHTISFAQDLKLAHYMKIPQRVTFAAQSIATLVSTFVCVGILNFQMTQINDVCSPTQPDHFTCPGINTFFTASVLWGTLGPRRMFGTGRIYNGLIWCFLIGFILPFIFYFAAKRWKIFELVHLPVILVGGLIWAPFNMANVWPAIPIAWLFNVYIKRRYLAWWGKYSYITTTAFSCAIAISAIVMFFALQWPNVVINWSGNNRPFEGCDGIGCPLKPIPEQGFFGPGPGEFH
ncbi:OPT-domain-containing protein [Punctularia strigosozonata HHB-11173 SS5]|uniref:OPT-domain-containing protein n=1 Tax=Punctularia strigosozonata (strain HHB-11173) TaxID=741275 RepID=UPI000441815A|nr:OPT-domain-containing protein [Punctularia strigosozonata HHB-11173 SS5]EIN12782.1 OPT-domain-containing protein [Punctularia strigosozonata HHB-11173 SS5]